MISIPRLNYKIQTNRKIKKGKKTKDLSNKRVLPYNTKEKKYETNIK